jgi:hypothetical protein
MKVLGAGLVLLCTFAAQIVSAQAAKPSDLQTAGGFLDACGNSPNSLSKKGMEALQDSMATAAPDRAAGSGLL